MAEHTRNFFPRKLETPVHGQKQRREVYLKKFAGGELGTIGKALRKNLVVDPFLLGGRRIVFGRGHFPGCIYLLVLLPTAGSSGDRQRLETARRNILQMTVSGVALGAWALPESNMGFGQQDALAATIAPPPNRPGGAGKAGY